MLLWKGGPAEAEDPGEVRLTAGLRMKTNMTEKDGKKKFFAG